MHICFSFFVVVYFVVVVVFPFSIEFQKVSTSGQGEWLLTDIDGQSQLGSSSRVEAKGSSVHSLSASLDMQESSLPVQILEKELRAYKLKVEDMQRRTEDLQEWLERAEKKSEESERRIVAYQKSAKEADMRAENSHKLTQLMEASLTEMSERLKECEELLVQSCSHWIVRREEIELTGPELGSGGWATVSLAKFRGVQVAVKRIHKEIISRHNIELFQREMSIAAKLRHPNLVQFIGATIEGEMMILMELMTTSLRSQLKKDEYFTPKVVKSISIDVAQGLTYLHQIKPEPIVHRDISSANVLLEELPRGTWKAKLADYGSVNLVRQLNTENPGSPAYAAPEASIPHLQSPKMDIYSFGALVLEMLTGRLPVPDLRRKLLCQVHQEQLLSLIRRCLNDRSTDRPTASGVVSELTLSLAGT